MIIIRIDTSVANRRLDLISALGKFQVAFCVEVGSFLPHQIEGSSPAGFAETVAAALAGTTLPTLPGPDVAGKAEAKAMLPAAMQTKFSRLFETSPLGHDDKLKVHVILERVSPGEAMLLGDRHKLVDAPHGAERRAPHAHRVLRGADVEG